MEGVLSIPDELMPRIPEEEKSESKSEDFEVDNKSSNSDRLTSMDSSNIDRQSSDARVTNNVTIDDKRLANNESKKPFQWRQITTKILPIFLLVILVSAGAIAAVPSWRISFNRFIAKWSPKASEMETEENAQAELFQAHCLRSINTANSTINIEAPLRDDLESFKPEEKTSLGITVEPNTQGLVDTKVTFQNETIDLSNIFYFGAPVFYQTYGKDNIVSAYYQNYKNGTLQPPFDLQYTISSVNAGKTFTKKISTGTAEEQRQICMNEYKKGSEVMNTCFQEAVRQCGCRTIYPVDNGGTRTITKIEDIIQADCTKIGQYYFGKVCETPQKSYDLCLNSKAAQACGPGIDTTKTVSVTCPSPTASVAVHVARPKPKATITKINDKDVKIKNDNGETIANPDVKLDSDGNYQLDAAKDSLKLKIQIPKNQQKYSISFPEIDDNSTFYIYPGVTNVAESNEPITLLEVKGKEAFQSDQLKSNDNGEQYLTIFPYKAEERVCDANIAEDKAELDAAKDYNNGEGRSAHCFARTATASGISKIKVTALDDQSSGESEKNINFGESESSIKVDSTCVSNNEAQQKAWDEIATDIGMAKVDAAKQSWFTILINKTKNEILSLFNRKAYSQNVTTQVCNENIDKADNANVINIANIAKFNLKTNITTPKNILNQYGKVFIKFIQPSGTKLNEKTLEESAKNINGGSGKYVFYGVWDQSGRIVKIEITDKIQKDKGNSKSVIESLPIEYEINADVNDDFSFQSEIIGEEKSTANNHIISSALAAGETTLAKSDEVKFKTNKLVNTPTVRIEKIARDLNNDGTTNEAEETLASPLKDDGSFIDGVPLPEYANFSAYLMEHNLADVYYDNTDKKWKEKIFPGDKIYYIAKFENKTDKALNDKDLLWQVSWQAEDWMCKDNCGQQYDMDNNRRQVWRHYKTIPARGVVEETYWVKLNNEIPIAVYTAGSWTAMVHHKYSYIYLGETRVKIDEYLQDKNVFAKNNLFGNITGQILAKDKKPLQNVFVSLTINNNLMKSFDAKEIKKYVTDSKGNFNIEFDRSRDIVDLDKANYQLLVHYYDPISSPNKVIRTAALGANDILYFKLKEKEFPKVRSENISLDLSSINPSDIYPNSTQNELAYKQIIGASVIWDNLHNALEYIKKTDGFNLGSLNFFSKDNLTPFVINLLPKTTDQKSEYSYETEDGIYLASNVWSSAYNYTDTRSNHNEYHELAHFLLDKIGIKVKAVAPEASGKKIVLHWSGSPTGRNDVSPSYSYEITGDGTIHQGLGNAHTWNRNAQDGYFGLSVSCCGPTVPWTYYNNNNGGNHVDDIYGKNSFSNYMLPIQLDTMVELAAKLAYENQIPIDINHIMTHAEAASLRDFPLKDVETVSEYNSSCTESGGGSADQKATSLGMPSCNYGPSQWHDNWPGGSTVRLDFWDAGNDLRRRIREKYQEKYSNFPFSGYLNDDTSNSLIEGLSAFLAVDLDRSVNEYSSWLYKLPIGESEYNLNGIHPAFVNIAKNFDASIQYTGEENWVIASLLKRLVYGGDAKSSKNVAWTRSGDYNFEYSSKSLINISNLMQLLVKDKPANVLELYQGLSGVGESGQETLISPDGKKQIVLNDLKKNFLLYGFFNDDSGNWVYDPFTGKEEIGRAANGVGFKANYWQRTVANSKVTVDPIDSSPYAKLISGSDAISSNSSINIQKIFYGDIIKNKIFVQRSTRKEIPPVPGSYLRLNFPGKDSGKVTVKVEFDAPDQNLNYSYDYQIKSGDFSYITVPFSTYHTKTIVSADGYPDTVAIDSNDYWQTVGSDIMFSYIMEKTFGISTNKNANPDINTDNHNVMGGGSVNINADNFEDSKKVEVHIGKNKIGEVNTLSGNFGLEIKIPDTTMLGTQNIKLLGDTGQEASIDITVTSNKWFNKWTLLIFVITIAIISFLIYCLGTLRKHKSLFQNLKSQSPNY